MVNNVSLKNVLAFVLCGYLAGTCVLLVHVYRYGHMQYYSSRYGHIIYCIIANSSMLPVVCDAFMQYNIDGYGYRYRYVHLYVLEYNTVLG